MDDVWEVASGSKREGEEISFVFLWSVDVTMDKCCNIRDKHLALGSRSWKQKSGEGAPLEFGYGRGDMGEEILIEIVMLGTCLTFMICIHFIKHDWKPMLI